MSEAVKRIQRKRTKGWRMPEGTIYVGRPTDYGNPFVAGQQFQNLGLWIAVYGVMTDKQIEDWYSARGISVDSAEKAVSLFRDYANWRINVAAGGKEWIEKLSGHDLVCWCPLDQPCHADVLIELANK